MERILDVLNWLAGGGADFGGGVDRGEAVNEAWEVDEMKKQPTKEARQCEVC